MKSYSVQSILDWLETKDLLKSRRQAEAYVLSHANIDRLPIYIHVLMGIGALIGCWCVIGLLVATNIIDFKNEISLLTSGAISIIISLLLYYALRYKTALIQSFGLQCSLILMSVGKILFVVGFSELTKYHFLPLNEDWMWTLGIFIVTVPMYFCFPVQLDRFIWSLALLGSILFNTWALYHFNLYFFIYFIILILSTGLLFTWRNKTLSWSPLGYAVVFVLYACALHLSTMLNADLILSHHQKLMIPIIYFKLSLGIALVLLCLILSRERSRSIQLPTVAACSGLFLLSFVATPGILVSIGLLILGYAKHEKALSILGGVFLLLFLVYYYYSLPYTLDYKAGVLVATGAVLFAARFIIKSMNWDLENP